MSLPLSNSLVATYCDPPFSFGVAAFCLAALFYTDTDYRLHAFVLFPYRISE
jgi:hypothetical protein